MKFLPRCRAGVVLILTLMICVLFLGYTLDAEAQKKKKKKSGVTGKVMLFINGEPVEKAYVYGYVGKIESRAASLGIVGITDFISHGTKKDGNFKLDLPPGKYYIVARKRESNANFGPLRPGDLYDHTLGLKAVTIRKGKYIKRDFKLRRLAEPLFFQGLTMTERITNQGIIGRLLDEDGNDIPGTFAMAYRDDDMYRLPDFTSTVTDDEGNYTIYFPKGGRYWIAARTNAMRVPDQGEPFGRYEGSDDHSVVVKDNEFLRDIDITMRPYDGDPPEGYSPVHNY